jgi:hypothetical protein
MRWVRHIAFICRQYMQKNIIEKPEAKKLLGTPRYGLEIIVKMDIRDTECKGED